MNEFLDELESKIDALDEKERKKIVKKYQRIVEEKIKEGKTEVEVIEEFGSVDDIAKKICEDYHVNLVNRKKSFKDTLNKGIEEGAKFLAKTCEEIAEYTKSSTKDKLLVTFFEILLKIIVLIILFMLFKIPFILVQSGLDFVFGLLFYPFDTTLSIIFEYIISILYLVSCIASSIYMFKGYFINDITQAKDEEKLGELKQDKKEHSGKNINYAIVIIKTLIMIIIIIPMIFLNLTFLTLALLALFFIIKGISVVGLAIILLSFFLLTLIMTNYVADAIDNRNRNHMFPLCISVISLIIGIVLFVDDLIGYNYPEQLTNSHFETVTETLTLEVDKSTEFILLDGEVEYVVDNNIQDNKVLVEVTYYDDFVDIIFQETIGEELDSIVVYSKADDLNIDDYIRMYNNILKDLQDNNIFKYSDLDTYNMIIHCNEMTKELIK